MKSLGSIAVIPQTSRQLEIPAAETAKAVAFLEKSLPEDTDRFAEQRLQELFDNKLVIRKEARFGVEGGGFKDMPVAIERPEGLTQEQIDAARKSLTLSTQPGSSSRIVEELNELAVVSTTYENNKKDMAVKIDAYCRALDKYPADAVIAACRCEWEVFPPLAKLKAKARQFAEPRQQMLQIVNKWKPWSKADDIKKLRERLSNASFDARYYSVPGPNKFTKRAEAAKAAVPRITAEITAHCEQIVQLIEHSDAAPNETHQQKAAE